MIARLSMRSCHGGAVLTLFLIASRSGAVPLAAIGPGASAGPTRPSPARSCAKQIVEIKGVKNVFEPLVRGVVEKTKDMFMQTNFMWAEGSQ